MQILRWHLMVKNGIRVSPLMATNGKRTSSLMAFNGKKNSLVLAIQRPTGAPAIQCHSMSFRLRRSLLTHVTSYIVTRVRAHVTL